MGPIALPAAILGSAVIGAGASYLGGAAQRKAGHEAAGAQQYAADKNAETQRYFYDTTRGDLAPWMKTGGQANASMADLMGLNGEAARTRAFMNFREDPGYQFAFGEGQRALERSAAGKGGLYSGRAGTALAKYGQGMADQQYGNYYARLYGLSNEGQNAAAKIGSAGTAAGAGIGSGYMQAGQGIAGANLYGGNAGYNMYQDFGNAIGSGLNNYYYANKMGYLKSPNRSQDWSGSSDDMFLNNRP